MLARDLRSSRVSQAEYAAQLPQALRAAGVVLRQLHMLALNDLRQQWHAAG